MTDYNSSSASAQTNPLSIASLVSGVAAWVIGGLGSCLMTFVFFPLAFCTAILFLGGNIAAAIMGHMARNQIRQNAGAQTGDGMALTGIVLGWGGVGISVLAVCGLILVAVLLGPAIGSVYSEIMLTLTPQP
ncbi:MAG: hypothetical protein A2W37_11680 [Chloroflexi bacterium RBG_16_63_12]|jgi:hypothetical protein|nr:MAG: hypothetical protein A2W37_11680 [Chloroflexi bacterium RBG_16_63_12]